MITYLHRHNHCSARNARINSNLIDSDYPRCNEPETQVHAIKQLKTKELQRELIKETTKEMIEKNKSATNGEKILVSIEDIVNFLQNKEPGKYNASQ